MTNLPFKEIYKHDRPVTTKLNKYEYNSLKIYCIEHKIKMSFVIRELIKAFLSNVNPI